MRTNITAKMLNKLEPSSKPYFIRSTKIIGFGIKVNPSGAIRFIAETKYNGKTYRKSIGNYPITSIQNAEKEARIYLHQIQSGIFQKPSVDTSLQDLFNKYITTIELKPNTLKNYREVIFFYLKDWMNMPVKSISKQMVEERFFKIRDKGIQGGKPTYSQATKTMRILSALMNHARADDIIEINPVEILKLKRIDRSIKKRDHYLKAEKVQELLKNTSTDYHPVTLAVHLMLFTGLRKNEALKLRWSDIEVTEGIKCLAVQDTELVLDN